MIIHSIRWRLQAWHGFLLVCLVAGLMTGFYTFERRGRWQAIDNDLHEAMTPLLPKLVPPMGRGPREYERGERGRRLPPPEDGDLPRGRPPEDRPPPGRTRETRPFDSEHFYYLAWSPQGGELARSTNAPAEIPLPQFTNAKEKSLTRTRGLNRELARLVPNGTWVLVGTSLSTAQVEMRKLAVALTIIGCGILVVGLGVGWWTAGRALRPIAEISLAAREIAAGALSKRINPSETESELGQLATVLNATFARLEAAFARQQQFTSDAAHELRTPVTVILTQVQSTLNKERSGPEYRETLEACQRAAQRMRRIIESLLGLARLDAGQASSDRERLDLARVAADCVALVHPLGDERRIIIQSDLPPVDCAGDADQLSLVITNLLTNAIQYNRNGGEVRITTRHGNGWAILTVADNGPGVAAEHLPHIFQRFYRVDQARSNSPGSAGLGLSICKAIVEAHSGTIEVASEPDKGVTFTVRLPVS